MRPDADRSSDDPQALYARVVRRLGRNARAGEPLDADDAHALWQALLAQRYTAAQEAALLMALRVHGEGPAVLAAFARATAAGGAQVRAPAGRAVVVLHALGGARRQPLLAPLLALRLAALEVPVLVLTYEAGPAAGSAAVLAALGHAPALDGEQAAAQLAARRLAWWPVERWAPPLARLLALRATLGFRNSAHAAARLVAPVQGRAVLVAQYTHAAYREAYAHAVVRLGLSALLVRGTEGDPVAREAQAHPPQAWLGGRAVALPAIAGSAAAGTAALPAPLDVAATARYTAAAAGAGGAVPVAIERQAQWLAALAARCAEEAG